MKTLNERYFFSRSAMPSRMISCQFSGSFQSWSVIAHSLGLGRSRIFKFLGFPG